MRRYKAPRKKSPKRKLNQAVDLLIKEQVLERDGHACVRCGKTQGLAASHILPKGRYPRLRFELLNLLTMCTGCHIFWWHKNPIEAKQWLDAKYPMRFDQLQVLAAISRKVDAKELLIALRSEAND